MLAQELLYLSLVPAKIAERCGMPQRKFQRLECFIKTQQPERAGSLPGGMQHREHIGGRAQADIPNDEVSGCVTQPLDESNLPYIQGFSLRYRTNHGMESLIILQ